MEKISTMNVVLFSSKKQKKIIHQLRTSSAFFSSIIWLNKEILMNMWNINIFIILLLILNYETSGKHLYLSCIEHNPLKHDIIYQRRQKSNRRLQYLKEIPWNLYHAFESDGVRVFETQLNSFTEQTHRLRVSHSIQDFF